MSENVLVAALNLIVAAMVARYLGPSNFGLLSYAFALAAIFGVIGRMGLDGLVIRELAEDPDHEAEVLGTTFILKLVAFFAASMALATFGYLTADSSAELLLLWLAAATLLVAPFLTTGAWFHAHVAGRYFAISNISSHFISGALKVGAVLSSLSVLAFAAANIVQAIVAAVLALTFYTRKSAMSVLRWRFSRDLARRLLKEGWIVFAAGMLGMIYLKIDQVMLRWLASPELVGVYSVAAKLSEAAYFIPGALMASVFPRLITLKRDSQSAFAARLQMMFDIMAIVALAIVLAVLVAAPWGVVLVFGSEYSDASLVLAIHILALPFIFLRTVFTRWLLIERFTGFLLVSDGIGAALNIGFNLLLIPHYGAIGAAIATVCSYAVASYFALPFHPKTRPAFLMMTRSLFLPWRGVLRLRQLLVSDASEQPVGGKLPAGQDDQEK